MGSSRVGAGWEGRGAQSGSGKALGRTVGRAGAPSVWGKAPGQGRSLGRDPDDKDPGAPPVPPVPPEDGQPPLHRTECLSGCSWGRGSPLPGTSIATEQEGWPCPPERGTQNFLKTGRARRAAPLRSLPAAPREGPPSMICSDSADRWGFLGRVTGPAFHWGCGHGQKRPPVGSTEQGRVSGLPSPGVPPSEPGCLPTPVRTTQAMSPSVRDKMIS